MKLFELSQNQGKVFDIIGKIIDYQTPLKDIQTDKAGKIDLLAYNENEEEKTLRILELKKPDSEETMLRCVLEAYTYLKVVDKDKLLKDFGLPENTKIKACPFVFYGKEQYKEMQEDRKNLKDLIKELVTINVEKFNKKIDDKDILSIMTNEYIAEAARSGKIGDEVHGDKKANLEKALDTAYLAFEDGLYCIFVNDEQTEKLEDNLALKDGDVLTFIKLTMLAGRMW